ncbi:MAG: VWA domain-containing protein [Armatimonadetes bacterium]|nr:VWA domain-containing protein [Armatimonadota bacterium]
MKKTLLVALAAALLAATFMAGYSSANSPTPAQPVAQKDPPKPAPVAQNDPPKPVAPKDPPKPVAPKDPPRPADPKPAPKQDAQQNVIQLALLLDTSGSMDGLLEQAKGQLWRIVNEFSRSNRNGQAPRVEVALYEYGKSTVDRKQGYVRQILPFTTDLDRVSEELFALRTDGGDEYCGWAMKAALRDLKWKKTDGTLRFLFIAGNEPFNQGPVDFRTICGQALQQGVTVNTIFCGQLAEGESTGWKDGAALARGRFLAIDQNQQVAEIEAPQDAEIARLGAELNQTYIPYGQAGHESYQRQAAQDEGSAKMGSVVARSYTKASSNYKNDSWDLVDAVDQKTVDAGKLEAAQLPAEMQTMNAPQREAYVKQKAEQRRELQKRIQGLYEERNGYVQEKEKENAASPDTLDQAIVRTVREQAGSKGYHFTE